MIDLHIHSKYSIGELSVDEILEQTQDLRLFSIVDNDHCLAYNNLDLKDYPQMITGTVFTTTIDSQIINILGYEVNPKMINDFYYNHYGKDAIEKIEYKLFDALIQIMEKNNIVLSDDIQLTLVERGVSKKLVYYDAKKNNEDFPFLTYQNFYRDGLSNPFSDYFLNESEMLPNIKDVIDIIKQSGGLVFLAHPYEYGIKVDPLIEKLIPLGLEGIEVFHPSAAIRQSLKLIDICESNNLHASGGSDFRKARYHIPIGINTHHNMLDMNCFKWMKKYHEDINKEDQ